MVAMAIHTVADIERFRRSEANITRLEVTVSSSNASLDAELERALERNRTVTEIDIRVAPTTAPRPILHGIVARMENLRVLRLKSQFLDSIYQPVPFLSSFLAAIQSNNSLQSLVLSHWKLSVEVFCSLVGRDNAPTQLTFWSCFWDLGATPSAATISEAFRRNTKIRTLTLHWVNEYFLRSMLKGLPANNTIKTLIFGEHMFPQRTAEVMRDFLKDTTTIQRFELTGTFRATTIPSLVSGLIASQSVTEIKFAPTNMSDESSVRSFHDLLATKQNLRSLILEDDGFYSNWMQDQDIVSSLARNYGILTVSISSSSLLQLREPDEARLQKLLFRNARLLEWTQNPESVPRLLWPEALKMAMMAGKETLYRSLLETMGRSSGEPRRQRGRKRKRTEFFVPS